MCGWTDDENRLILGNKMLQVKRITAFNEIKAYDDIWHGINWSDHTVYFIMLLIIINQITVFYVTWVTVYIFIVRQEQKNAMFFSIDISYMINDQ